MLFVQRNPYCTRTGEILEINFNSEQSLMKNSHLINLLKCKYQYLRTLFFFLNCFLTEISIKIENSVESG